MLAAANGSNEPYLPIFCIATNVHCDVKVKSPGHVRKSRWQARHPRSAGRIRIDLNVVAGLGHAVPLSESWKGLITDRYSAGCAFAAAACAAAGGFAETA